MIISRERVLSREETRSILDRMNGKAVIKYTLVGSLGISIAKFVMKNSITIDKFFFKDLPVFLSRSDLPIVSYYLKMPNWFLVVVILGLIVGVYAESKMAKAKINEKRRVMIK